MDPYILSFFSFLRFACFHNVCRRFCKAKRRRRKRRKIIENKKKDKKKKPYELRHERNSKEKKNIN